MSAFAQTTIHPTGRSGKPPGPLKEEFQRPMRPPSPVLPVVPLPPETGVVPHPGTVRVFVQSRPLHPDNHPAFFFHHPSSAGPFAVSDLGPLSHGRIDGRVSQGGLKGIQN